MPECHVAHIRIRHHNILQATVPLELSYRFFKEAARERGIGHVGRIISKDGSHVLVQCSMAHALQAQEVLIREQRPVLVVKCLDDLGQGSGFVLVVRLGSEINNCS